MNFYQLNEQICSETLKNWWQVYKGSGLGTSGYLLSGVSNEDYEAFKAEKPEFQQEVSQWMQDNINQKPMHGSNWLKHAIEQVRQFGGRGYTKYVPGQLGVRR